MIVWLQNHWKNLIIIMLGIILMAIGGDIFISASIGGDAMLVMNQGIGVSLKTSTGNAMIISNIIGLVFVLIFYRKSIGIGTLLVTVLLGLALNLIGKLNLIKASEHLIINILLVLTGIIIGGFGIALYIYANLGLSPFEGIIMFVVEKSKWRFFIIKIINDAILFTLGYLLGGRVGLGSILTVLMFGPIIDFYLFLLNKTNIIKKDQDVITN